jgi:hypothetical protein
MLAIVLMSGRGARLSSGHSSGRVMPPPAGVTRRGCGTTPPGPATWSGGPTAALTMPSSVKRSWTARCSQTTWPDTDREPALEGSAREARNARMIAPTGYVTPRKAACERLNLGDTVPRFQEGRLRRLARCGAHSWCQSLAQRRHGFSKWHRGHSFSPPSRPLGGEAPQVAPRVQAPAAGSLRCGYRAAS